MNISSEIFKIDMYHYDLLSFYFTKEYPFKFAQSASKYGVYDHVWSSAAPPSTRPHDITKFKNKDVSLNKVVWS